MLESSAFQQVLHSTFLFSYPRERREVKSLTTIKVGSVLYTHFYVLVAHLLSAKNFL